MKKPDKIKIGLIHLAMVFFVFSLLIFLIYKVTIKFGIKKNEQSQRHEESGFPFTRITILNPTPLYASPDEADLLSETLPVSAVITVYGEVKKRWTFYKVKIEGKTRWVKSQLTSHVPVRIKKGTNLTIGRELVDKTHSLPYSYKPTDLKKIPRRYNSPYDERKHYLRKEALDAFIKMFRAAREEGIKLYVISAFRSAKYQMGLYLRSIAKNNNPDQNGTAKPTYSEHQLGTTVDLTSKQAGYRLTQDFEKTKAFKWLKENMAKFNMVLSFPRNNSQGYIYEPWHIRYVGKRLN